MASEPPRPGCGPGHYPNIENHGVVGNMKTLALVSTDCTVDWFCYPHFDSPSVFAGLLDARIGGAWTIAPRCMFDEDTLFSVCAEKRGLVKQFYVPDTNVLVTRFYTEDGNVAEVVDFMPVHVSKAKRNRNLLVRKVMCKAGQLDMRSVCCPAFDYARVKHTVEIDDGGATFRAKLTDGNDVSMRLASRAKLEQCGDGAVCADFVLEEGQSTVFYLGDHENKDMPSTDEDAEAKLFQNTLQFWRDWIKKCSYKGRWREMIYRSALVMKLLTFEETGAIVAAGTTSLPEQLGGVRNWDYRYMWVRDAAFTLYGFMRIGFTEEAEAFMGFLENILEKSMNLKDQHSGPLQVMYKINGDAELSETVLTHLEGYKGSKPVRIGNFAVGQLQLDIYGELMDAVYLYNKYGAPVSYRMWEYCRMMVNWVCDNWNRPDESIWEMRTGRKHYVYSKVMCWVAIDRGLRLADRRSFPAPRERWLVVRDQIYEDVMSKGWSESRKAFVMYYGAEVLDAANLIMPLVLFLSADDPRFLATLEAVRQAAIKGGLVRNSLVARYDTKTTYDALDGPEGTFNICSFWYVECLTRVKGSRRNKFLNEAILRFEDMLSYANHVGLFSEETSEHGHQMGNFPQAFSHLSLISAGFNLNRNS